MRAPGSVGHVMAVRYETISFLSDYGRVDEFVGVCHSVIRAIAPEVAVVDLTHDVPPHDIRAGALTLARSVGYLCPGVVLAVVDPGVGTDRRAVAVEVGDGQSVLVGPDNGLLAPAVAMCGGATRVVELTSPAHRLEPPGATFDGRDVFAPAAAHLCAGVPLDALGPALDPALLRPALVPVTRVEDGDLVAEVLWTDRFGNLQLNVDPDEVADWGERIRLRFAGARRTATRVTAYAELAAGELGVLVDSSGLLSVVLDQTSAAEVLGLDTGDEVVLERLDGPDGGRGAGGDGAEADVEVTVAVELRGARP